MTQLKPGDKAPDFTAVDQHGKSVRLADFNGRKLFIYFFPKANTSG
jgi:peroxiredoxin Q/BCP